MNWAPIEKALKEKPTWNNQQIKNQLIPLILQNLPTEPVASIPPIPGASETTKYRKVDVLKKYDVIYMTTMNMSHYLLVHKVKDGVVYGVILTSKEKVHTIYRIERDRFFKDGYASSTYLSYPLDEAIERFARVYENRVEANRIFRTIAEYYRKQFNLKSTKS